MYQIVVCSLFIWMELVVTAWAAAKKDIWLTALNGFCATGWIIILVYRIVQFVK